MHAEQEERLKAIQKQCDDAVANLKKELDDKLSADTEKKIREFELIVHRHIAEAQERYRSGMERAENIPETLSNIKEAEKRRLGEGLGRALDSLLDTLSNFKKSM